MVECFEGSIDVIGHGYINVALVVVPIEGEAAVKGAGPVNCQLIVCCDRDD